MIIAAVTVGAAAALLPATPAAEPVAGGDTARAGAAAAATGDVEFMRVRVPRGRMQDVPLGAERHVPLSAVEFDRALARLGPAAARFDHPRSLPASARYELRPDANGGLIGRVVIDVQDAGPGRFLALGAVRSAGGSVRTARGAGAAVVFGMPGGGVALATPEPGTYTCDVACPAAMPGAPRIRLPLVGCLATTVMMEHLPASSRPLVSADAGKPFVRRLDAGDAESTWRIDVGAVTAIDIEIVDRDRPAPRIAAWTRASVRGNSVELATQLVPAGPWHGDTLVLEKSPAVRPTSVRIAGGGETIGWREADAGRELRIELPADIQARAVPLVVEAIGPATQGRDWVVPTCAVGDAVWGGGGIVLTVAADLVVEAVDGAGTGCLLVAPEVAARWPVPTAPAAAAEPAALMYFELQRRGATPRVVLRPRSARFDAARVTTVELALERVVGRAACDVRVVAGEAFGLDGQIMPGWVIDSVEAVDWDDDRAAGRESAAVGGRRVEPSASRVLEWSDPEPGRSGVRPLRIALDAAATPARGVGLRITGHRQLGVPFDTGFETGEMDMVRLVGESADQSVIDFRPAPDALVEVGGAPLGLFMVAERLEPLVEEPAPRGRIRGGDQVASRKAVLVRRRPPLDADVAIDLAAREEVVAQTFRFTLQTAAAPIDSLVVHFSEPMGTDLDWELVSPTGGGLVARRVEATDPTGAGLRDRSPGESWLVELSPAVVGRARVRAARVVSGTKAVPVPLAWVEAATRPGGTVLVRGEGASRPVVRNRRLRELPPSADAPTGTVVEFGYSDTDRRTSPGPAAADVLPPQPDAEARAWAWHETSVVWCHDSGATEIESRFDIENHGRDAVTLTPLFGCRLHEVLIDGRPLDLPAIDAAGGSLRVPLPAGRSRFALEIRALAHHVPRLGCWWVETSSCTIDLPVLDRRLRLLVPPELEAVTFGGRHREVAAQELGWRERLFGLPSPSTAAAAADEPDDRPAGKAGSLAVGFRSRWFVPTIGAADAVGIGIVRRRRLDAAAIVSAWLMIVAASFAARRSLATCVVLCAVAAIAALWIPAPFHIVARVAWWAGVAGLLVAARRRSLRQRPVVVGLAALLACGGGAPAVAAEAATPLRVFVMPGEQGDDVLVPERLFRLLAVAAGEEDVGFRIVTCRIRAAVAAADAPWSFELDVVGEPGGRAVLDQRPCGARWIAPEPAAAAATVELDAKDGVARLSAVAGGRLTVRLAVRPAVERRGDVEFIAACVPPAARAVFELVDDEGRPVQPTDESLQCDAACRGAPFFRVAAGVADGMAFDVGGAAAVRLVRPADRRDRLVSGGLRRVHTINQVEWGLDACRLQASFEVDPAGAIARSFVVTAPPGFVPLEPDGPEHTIVPMGAGRHLVELRAPRRGAARVELGFESAIVDPVGRFTVPEARVEAAVSDVLDVRLNAADELDVDVEPPAAAVPAALADVEPQRHGLAWRMERGEGAPAGDTGARLTVRRQPQEVRAAQRLAVELGGDGVSLRLRARIDAPTAPLATIPVAVPHGFTVTRVAVFEEDVAAGGAADPLDIEWNVQEDALAIVVQRPRAGRFRLEVDAARTAPPAPRGPLPILQAALAGGAPLAVEWRQGDGGTGIFRQAAEVTAGGPRPEYELVTTPLPVVRPPAVELPEAAAPGQGAPRDGVLVSRVHVAVDDTGRLRGVARFDLLTSGGFVRLRLPERTRLLDVLVDGREVPAVPEEAKSWVVKLHDSLWPRSLAVVFGADVGPRGTAGTVQLAAPTIDGLRGAETVWTIDPPPGATVQIADPGRQIDEASWKAKLISGEARVVAAFGPVIAATPEPLRGRYRVFTAALNAGSVSALEAAWDDALPRLGGGGGRVHGVAAADGTIPCRINRVGDASVPSRVAMTAVLAAVIVLARAVAARGRRAGAAV